jgi:hypothetical protein
MTRVLVCRTRLNSEFRWGFKMPVLSMALNWKRYGERSGRCSGRQQYTAFAQGERGDALCRTVRRDFWSGGGGDCTRLGNHPADRAAEQHQSPILDSRRFPPHPCLHRRTW